MNHKGPYMRKNITIGTTLRRISLILFCLLPLKGICQTGEATVDALVKMGFENVGWTEDTEERVFVIQNSAYRLEGVGIGKAVDLIQKMGLPERKPCCIIVLNNNVPQISLYYQPSFKDSTVNISRQDWEVSYNLGNSWNKVKRNKKANSSLYKVDITIYPELSLKNLVITQIYQVLFNLSPAIEVSFWKGMKFTAQMVIPVYNDGYASRYDKLHPGFLELSQTVRLPYNFWATLAIGSFNNSRYGIDFNLIHHFKDERFSIEGRIGYTGTGYWEGFTMHYGTKMRATWSLGGSFYWPRYNVELNARVEQYLLQEKAVRVEAIRHFRYASIGFYAMKAKDVKANGGFRFQIALPPYRYKRKGYIPRIIPSNNMGMSYNAGNEQYYYKTYRSAPDDNIMKNNSFNPYFIKSELLNF